MAVQSCSPLRHRSPAFNPECWVSIVYAVEGFDACENRAAHALLRTSELGRKVREGRGAGGQGRADMELVECTRRDPG